MLIYCSYCDSDVALPDKFETIELSHNEVRVDGELLHVCREMRARAARARATAAVTRDVARATIATSRRLLTNTGDDDVDH